MASKDSPIEFTKLNSICSLYTPSSKTPSSEDDPTTIVICQWMGASPRSRYLKSFYGHYTSMYPAARIISLRSTYEHFLYQSTATRIAALKPVIPALQSDPAPKPRVLLHAISNGGTLTLSDICQMYKKQTGDVLPIKAVIMDSAPGDPTLMEGWNAMSLGLPKNALWYPLALIMWLLNIIAWTKQEVLMMPNLVRQTRKRLNDTSLVDPKAKRLYVYSDQDQMSGWMDVERHAGEAEGLGVDVLRLKVEGSDHIQHASGHEERYWQMVGKLWDGAKD